MELDPVTSLPFVSHLRQYVFDRLQREDRLLVCYLDCAGMTEWNDVHGWTGGDKLLRQFAERFTAELDRRFEAVRLTGDVVAVCEAIASDVDPAAEAAMVHGLADRLMAELSGGQVRFRLVWHLFLRSGIALVDKGCRLLENAASSYREPAVFALPELALLPGVGDRVHKLIAWAFGQRAVEGCGCGAWIDQMNDWGPAGCREHLDEIVDHLVDVATKRNWTLNTVGARDGEPVPRTLRLRLARLAARGIVRAPLGGCVLRKICREGVLLAIRQAEAQQNGG